MIILDFHFLQADICQCTILCEFNFGLRNAVQKSYQMYFGVFENLYQKVYLQVWTLSCPNLNVAVLAEWAVLVLGVEITQ
jgi:hypothetical protein